MAVSHSGRREKEEYKPSVVGGVLIDVRNLPDEILGDARRQKGQASPTSRGGIDDILGQLGQGRGGSAIAEGGRTDIKLRPD